MLNGDGMRVILWVSGCDHRCKGCQNPKTWDYKSGFEFTEEIQEEILQELAKEHIQGITFSGGDPLNFHNTGDTLCFIDRIRKEFDNKDVWLYTGYDIEMIPDMILSMIDVIVDGKFDESKAEENYKWAGSTNQRVIDLRAMRQLFDKETIKKYGYAKLYKIATGECRIFVDKNHDWRERCKRK